MNYYNVELWIADETKRAAIDLQGWRDFFWDARDNFNETCKNARNPKQILEIDVFERKIALKLASREPLSAPTLALRSFSQFLAATDFGKRAAAGKALFRGNSQILEDACCVDDITAPETIKLLAELLMTGKKADEARIKRIQNSLIEWRDQK